MTTWSQDSTLPGEFTGHTGARVLSEKELEPMDPRFHAWAKKVPNKFIIENLKNNLPINLAIFFDIFYLDKM
jgi:hypothetical protein